MINNVIYRHYGNKCFDKRKFVEVSNRPYWKKPIGCFWASPKDSDNGWEYFCETNDFEKLAEDYDALYVEIDSQLYWDLYGWDIDTLCVFNPEVIKSIG